MVKGSSVLLVRTAQNPVHLLSIPAYSVHPNNIVVILVYHRHPGHVIPDTTVWAELRLLSLKRTVSHPM